MKLKLTEIRDFQEELTFLMKIFFLIYLGMFFDPNLLLNVSFVTSALLIIFAMLVGRLAMAQLFRISSREDFWAANMVFPRALAAAVLTITLVEAKVVTLDSFFSIAFVIIILTNIITTIAVYMHERKKGKMTKEIMVKEKSQDMKTQHVRLSRLGIVGFASEQEKRKLTKAVQNALKQVHSTMEAQMSFVLLVEQNRLEIFAADEPPLKTFNKKK